MNFLKLRQIQRTERRHNLTTLDESFFCELDDYCKKLQENNDKELDTVLVISNEIIEKRLLKIMTIALLRGKHLKELDDISTEIPELTSLEINLLQNIMSNIEEFKNYVKNEFTFMEV